MSELMTKEEIAKELLKPYFDDPSLCSISEGNCLYNGLNGKMCAFAMACTPEGRKNLKEGESAVDNLCTFGFDVLHEKYRHIEDFYFWVSLQDAHDDLGRESMGAALSIYEDLTGEEFNPS